MRSELKKMMDYCTYCPKMCRFSCPVSEAAKSETYTPWGKMEIAGWLLDKTVPISQEMALAAYQCTNCLHCQVYCEHGNDVPSALGEARKIAVENYAAPPQAYALEKNFHEFNNPYRPDLLEGLRHPAQKSRHKKKDEVYFFPCCHTLQLFPERLARYFELFEKLGIDGPQLFDNGLQCCGEPLRALGFAEGFKDVAEVQYYALKSRRMTVTDGPECCYSFKQPYADLGFSLRDQSLHLLEFLAPYLQHSNYQTKGRIKGRLTYLDPPFLSRRLGLIELPRKILSELTGFAPLELSMAAGDARSVGVEGSYDVIFPELSERIAEETVEEVSARGIGKLITADAKSEAILRKLAKGFEVQDIFEFLNEHIEKE